jgi:hypothetical protein
LYGKTTDITIPLTDRNIHVVEFGRSYFTIEVTATVMIQKQGISQSLQTQPCWSEPGGAVVPQEPVGAWAANPADHTVDGTTTNHWYDDPKLVALAKSQYMFTGFKSATDVIYQYKVTHNGLDITGTLVQKAPLESYLFNAQKPKSEWENKAGTMTLWEDAHKHDTSVCGQYFSYWELYQKIDENDRLTLNFDMNIGFDDMLIFQAFEMFPSCALGELALVIQVCPDALVWCCCDLVTTIIETAERGALRLDKYGDSTPEEVQWWKTALAGK